MPTVFRTGFHVRTHAHVLLLLNGMNDVSRAPHEIISQHPLKCINHLFSRQRRFTLTCVRRLWHTHTHNEPHAFRGKTSGKTFRPKRNDTAQRSVILAKEQIQEKKKT